MAYYWPQYGVAIQVNDAAHLLPIEEEAFPAPTVYHVTAASTRKRFPMRLTITSPPT